MMVVIKFIACGVSYRFAVRMVLCVKEETKSAYYGGCTEEKVCGYIYGLIATNLQKIALLLRASWAFSLATDIITHQATTYMDVRVRIWHRNALHKIHLLTFANGDRYSPSSVLERLE